MIKKLLFLLVLLLTATTGAWATDGIACSASDIGKVLCTDGSIYATVGDATTAQKTAAAMIAYIDATNNKGLAIALADESGTKDYEAAGTACSGKAAVTGGTWRLPSDKDWQYMFIGCGSSESYSAPTYDPHMSKSYSGLASKLTTAQGAALQSDFYWSSTKDEPNGAWGVVFDGSNATFYMDGKTYEHQVRACLEFDVTSTYTVSLKEGTEDATNWQGKAGEGEYQALPLEGVAANTAVSVKYNGTKKVKSVKAVKKNTAKTLAEATSEDIGKIAGKDGNIYATKADAEAVATGNAVAMIAYVGTASDCDHGLAIALADESGTKNYGAAGTACSGKAAVTGGTWRLPSIKDWQYMFIGCGASGSYSATSTQMSCSEFASKLTTAQGNALQTAHYWSSTEISTGSLAWNMVFDVSRANFIPDDEYREYPVRACLAF